MHLSEVFTMVEHEYKDLFYKRNTDKQLKIATDDGLFTATNSDIKWENFELTESLCSDSELKFGSCEASTVKFQILNAFIPLSGKWLTITETIGENADTPFRYGRYKVFSDKPTADKEYRDIVAYDSMYDILNADVSAWYNTILPNKESTKTLKQFRESFVRHFGLTEFVPEDGLINDNMTVERTIDPEQISGKDVITAICEISGCFGHIGRDGKFHYIYLPQDIQGLYPAEFLYPDHVPEEWDYLSQAETGHLYPQNSKGEKFGNGKYIKCQYEDYVVRTINKLQIRMEENDIGVIYGAGDNCYVIQDNFLVYGKSTAELNVIAENIYNKIRGVVYRPFSAECPGNPCLEVGDPIRLQTKYKIVESYILKRTLKGIQGLKDSYSSNGLEKRSENVNSVQKSIIQLKGKTNTLTRTVEENRLEIKDIERNLQSEIKQTAESITINVNKQIAETKEYADDAADEKLKSYSTTTQMNSAISLSAQSIKSEVSATYETKSDAKTTRETLQSSITQNANSITTEVARASASEDALSTRITQNAESITSKVTKGNVSSEISQEAGKISIKSDRFSLESTNCTIAEDGRISAQNVDLSGTITASGGEIGLFTIDKEGQWLEYYKDEHHVCGLGATAAIYAGNADSMQAPFHVTYDGKLHAESGKIAGWDLTQEGFQGKSSAFGQTLISPDGALKLYNFNRNDYYLISEMNAGMVRIDVGEGGTITLCGTTFTYQDFEALKNLINQDGEAQ